MRISVTIFLSLSFLVPSYTASASFEEIDKCSGVVQPKKKAKNLKNGPAFMVLVTGIENQGKGRFKPEYSISENQCLLAPIETKSGTITALHSPWTKGMQTLHYRFVLGAAAEKREFLVLYNGMASFMGGGKVFYVTETNSHTTKFYAAYTGQPRFKELKKLITKIVEGKSESIAEVQWPASSDELIITKYDSKKFR